jgi:hypothetical protein
MSARISESISALLVGLVVIGNAMPPRDPNDDDDEDEDEDVIREPDE